MLNVPPDRLAAADILRLVDQKIGEHRTIEYKRELPGQGERDHREFLADASSFANAGGGYILYGVEEGKGRAGARQRGPCRRAWGSQALTLTWN